MPEQKIELLEGKKRFPNLYALIGGYIHQDYRIDGETLEEVLVRHF